ncbi:hypothetical protein H8959_005138, partial [Pygathrix nigripes]
FDKPRVKSIMQIILAKLKHLFNTSPDFKVKVFLKQHVTGRSEQHFSIPAKVQRRYGAQGKKAVNFANPILALVGCSQIDLGVHFHKTSAKLYF